MRGLAVAQTVDGESWVAFAAGVGNPAVFRGVVQSEPICWSLVSLSFFEA
jgi:hypothetical protein